MNYFPQLPRPATFIARYVAALFLLLMLWGAISGYYLNALIALVNVATSLAGMPSQLQLPRFAGHDVVFTGVVGGIALFAVTPDRPMVWKLRWFALLVGLLSAAHLLVLFLQMHLVYLEILDHQDHDLPSQSLSAIRAAYRFSAGYLIEFWRRWGSAVLSLLLWLGALSLHGGPVGESAPD